MLSRLLLDRVVCRDDQVDTIEGCMTCEENAATVTAKKEEARLEEEEMTLRFTDPGKCENCRVDFPDVADGWLSADGSMAEAEQLILDRYGDGRREWFGHPARLTVEGSPPAAPDSSSGSSPAAS